MTDKQTIRAGAESTNIQAEEITFHQHYGLTYTDAKEIALDVFKNNFFQLAGEAADTANQRVEEFTENLIKRLQTESESLLESMKDPDMQYGVFTAQKEYARSGDEDLSEMLIEILVKRAEISDRSLMQIVLNESLEILPKLTQPQLDILSLVFIIRYTRTLTIRNLDELKEYAIKFIIPFLENIPESRASYQHLEYSGCASISVLEHKIEDGYKNSYPGIFMKGFTQEDWERTIGDDQLEKSIIIPCLHDNTLLQISALNDDVLKEICISAGGSEELCSRLNQLQNSHTLSGEEIKNYLTSLDPKIEKVFEVWNSTTLKMMTLTSVGIALAHTNMKRKLTEEIDLSIWIN